MGQLLCGVASGGEEYTISVTFDTYIYYPIPDGSFEGELSIWAGGLFPDYSWRGMLYYDLESLPSGIQILSASWCIYATGCTDGTPQDFALYEITEDWWNEDDDTWTWNNYCDSYDPDNPQLIHEPIESMTYQWYKFPFSDLTVLQKWVDNPSTNYGFMWKMDDDLAEEANWQAIAYAYEAPSYRSKLLIRDYYEDIQPTSIGYIKALFK